MKKLLIILSILFTSTLYAGDKLSTLEVTSLFGTSSVETEVLDNDAMSKIEAKSWLTLVAERLKSQLKLNREEIIRRIQEERARRWRECQRLVTMMRAGRHVSASRINNACRGF